MTLRSPLRVESSLNIQVPLSPGMTSDEQIKQGEEARKALYHTKSG